MRRFTLLAIGWALAAGCSAPPTVPRVRPAPRAEARPVEDAPKLVRPVDEEQTRAWLDREIERAPDIEPPRPIVQIIERTVERPVPVQAPYDPNWRYYDRSVHYRSRFPANTFLGAGIGAVIGHQSGHSARGAWIGGTIGYLLDIAR